MVSKDRKKTREDSARKLAEHLKLPLLFFDGKNPKPVLYMPNQMPTNPTTVIISGSDPDLHQLRRTARKTLRANIEDSLQYNTNYPGGLLRNISSFIFDLNKQQEYETKKLFGGTKIGKPNKATQLYWALHGQLVPWNRKTTAGEGTSTTIFWEANQPPLDSKREPQIPSPRTVQARIIPGDFGQPVPIKPYVVVDEKGGFHAMTGAQRFSFLNMTKPFSFGGNHKIYQIQGTKYVLGKFSRKITYTMKQAWAQKKNRRLSALKQLKLGDFAHLPVHVDSLTGDYYAEKIDGDLFDAATNDSKLTESLWATHWTPEKAAQALESFLAGVDNLHKQGWVHGDIKAENIYLLGTQQGIQLKLADWDTARTITDESNKDWVHETPTYSQFKLSYYGLGNKNPQQLKKVKDPIQKFKMAKCTDLLATIQTFTFVYQHSGLLAQKTLQSVKEKLKEILEVHENNHERTPPYYQLLSRSNDNNTITSDKRYDPEDVDKIYERVCRQVQELRQELQAVQPGSALQGGGGGKIKALFNSPVRADTFDSQPTAPPLPQDSANATSSSSSSRQNRPK